MEACDALVLDLALALEPFLLDHRALELLVCAMGTLQVGFIDEVVQVLSVLQ